ncbi:hypothetical protein L7F22_032359 [Adiantum nelumboides]|nr:hypothetical protein [Adiantum nelumboides]
MFSWGKVQDQEVLIFFANGTKANFISAKLTTRLGLKAEEVGPQLDASLAALGQEVAVTPLIGKLWLHGLQSQLEDLSRALPGYGHFGLSRKGLSDSSDEHCSVFYNMEQVEQTEGGTFWLSESPSIPASTSWGAAVPCIATWVISFEVSCGVITVVFYYKEHGVIFKDAFHTFQFKGVEPPGFTFQIVNTHLDNSSARARRRGALLTWQHIASLPPSLPVLYCGGFNAQKESAVGRFLLGRSREHGVVGDMVDAWASARRRKSSKLVRTYHGFKGENQGKVEKMKLLLKALLLCWDRRNQDLHMDWILFRGRTLTPMYAEVVDESPNGHYPSDHYPLYLEFSLPRSVNLQLAVKAPKNEYKAVGYSIKRFAGLISASSYFGRPP